MIVPSVVLQCFLKILILTGTAVEKQLFLLGNLRLNITFNHREDRTPSVAQGMLVDQDPEIDGPSCPGEYYWEQRHLTNLISDSTTSHGPLPHGYALPSLPQDPRPSR
ncbi:hypothetical protein I7I53_04171 [Histoplasma capsulatum var. duboisii H88]|uniref:Uncharacterized protein n=1 Tax=Ajellomyces capsulatus (strain H88) TaxID=544711 RepID=A0A8A1LUH8_AJEC8|nr:hypothetical protein I7I53_04171 [Histoplasma capsulatum var. duboisii H88]